MSNVNYKISKLAKSDLISIWEYTCLRWSKVQADRYYVLLISEIEFVTNNYLVGKSIEQTRSGYRVSKIKSHLIFYRKSENGIIEIVRILHQKMDIKNWLKD